MFSARMRRNDQDLVRRNEQAAVSPTGVSLQYPKNLGDDDLDAVPPTSNQVADTNDGGAVEHEASEPEVQQPAKSTVEQNNEQESTVEPNGVDQVSESFEPQVQNPAGQDSVEPNVGQQLSNLNEEVDENPDEWAQFTNPPSGKFSVGSNDDFDSEFPLLDSLPEVDENPNEATDGSESAETPVAENNPDQGSQGPVEKKLKLIADAVENQVSQDSREVGREPDEPLDLTVKPRDQSSEEPVGPVNEDCEGPVVVQDPQNQVQPDQVFGESMELQGQDSEESKENQDSEGTGHDSQENQGEDSEESPRKSLATLMCVVKKKEGEKDMHYYY